MRIWRMRTGISIIVTPSDRFRLEALVRDRNVPQKQVWWAEIVLLSADGLGTNEIMHQTGKSKTCVWRWQERFMQEGFEGLLRDKTRPSRNPPLGADVVARVVEITQTDPPGEATHWTATIMAKEAGISASSVQRIWRAHGLQPHRVRQFKLSNDPNFVDKLHDVVGLYVNPPEHAIVLSVDEKSQIQALDRTQPGLPLKKGRAATMTHDYNATAPPPCLPPSTCSKARSSDAACRSIGIRNSSAFSTRSRLKSQSKKRSTSSSTTMRPINTRRYANGSIAIRGSPSISRPPRHRGSMPSKASLPNSPNGVSNAASSGRSVNSRLPSTASSTKPTMIPSPSFGPQTQTKSSPPSNEGTNCWIRSTSAGVHTQSGQDRRHVLQC